MSYQYAESNLLLWCKCIVSLNNEFETTLCSHYTTGPSSAFWCSVMNHFGGGGGSAKWPVAKFFLYSSETVQLILIKFCEFKFNYTGYLSKLKTKSTSIDLSLFAMVSIY